MMQRDRDPGEATAGLTLVVPAVGARPRVQRQSLRFAAALAAALALHAAAFAATVAVFDATFGGGGRDADVIEISLVPGEALEAARTDAVPAVTGGINVADTPGSAAEPDAQSGATAPQGEGRADREVPQTEQRAALDVPIAIDTGEAPVSRAPDQAAAKAVPAPGDNAVAAAEGGSSVAPPRADAGAAAAATPGEIDAYNRSVAVALARLKPRGVGETGTAKVVFRIGTAGTVDDVRLAASTGKSKLDRLATDTVARAKFDTPPTGMTSAQLTYAIAFRFR